MDLNTEIAKLDQEGSTFQYMGPIERVRLNGTAKEFSIIEDCSECQGKHHIKSTLNNVCESVRLDEGVNYLLPHAYEKACGFMSLLDPILSLSKDGKFGEIPKFIESYISDKYQKELESRISGDKFGFYMYIFSPKMIVNSGECVSPEANERFQLIKEGKVDIHNLKSNFAYLLNEFDIDPVGLYLFQGGDLQADIFEIIGAHFDIMFKEQREDEMYPQCPHSSFVTTMYDLLRQSINRIRENTNQKSEDFELSSSKSYELMENTLITVLENREIFNNFLKAKYISELVDQSRSANVGREFIIAGSKYTDFMIPKVESIVDKLIDMKHSKSLVQDVSNYMFKLNYHDLSKEQKHEVKIKLMIIITGFLKEKYLDPYSKSTPGKYYSDVINALSGFVIPEHQPYHEFMCNYLKVSEENYLKSQEVFSVLVDKIVEAS